MWDAGFSLYDRERHGLTVRGAYCAFLGILTVCLAIAWLAILPVVALADDDCGNEARRAEQGSTLLPDCRAYELVTPPEKDSGEPKAVEVGFQEPRLSGIAGARASSDGSGMAWTSEYVLPSSTTPGLTYLSTRGVGGWSSNNVIPRQSVENGLLCPNLVIMAGYSSDLSRAILEDGSGQENPTNAFLGDGFECGHDEPRLVPGEPEGFQNLFYRNESGAYQLVNVTPNNVTVPQIDPGRQYFPASYLGGSADLSHVVFEEELQLTPEALSGDNLYEWSNGAVRLMTILPDGTPTLGSLAGSTRNTIFEYASKIFIPLNVADFRHAVSVDGSRVFFGAGGKLYVRKHADRPQSPIGIHGECMVTTDACTVQVDASQGSGPGGGGEFTVASRDGSRVYFTDTDSAGLTNDTVVGSGQNLYEYNLETSKLTDLTPSAKADVEGVSGASEDGSYIYFVAGGETLASSVAQGGTASGGTANQPNLYVDHDGVTTFIATLDPMNDLCDWTANTGCVEGVPKESGLTARVSANGGFIGFGSTESLTGYDNADVDTSEPDREIFLYESATNRLACASCDPDGARPTADAIIRYPALVSTSFEARNAYPQHNVSDKGQVFFETANVLLPRDTNGQRDVYEYENGQMSLISTGTDETGSYFLDATADGGNVFFATDQKLLLRDGDSAYDYYDARSDGGFAEPAGPGPSCDGDGCRGPASVVPVFSVPASATFVLALLTPVPKASKSKKNKAKKKKKKKKSKKGKKGKKGKKRQATKGRKVLKKGNGVERTLSAHSGGVK